MIFWFACRLQIIYKMEYNKTKARGYTLGHDTPLNQHMKKVKEITSNVGFHSFHLQK